MSKNTPNRHDTPKRNKKKKKPFILRTRKRILRAFKLVVPILEIMMALVRLIERLRKIGA